MRASTQASTTPSGRGGGTLSPDFNSGLLRQLPFSPGYFDTNLARRPQGQVLQNQREGQARGTPDRRDPEQVPDRERKGLIGGRNDLRDEARCGSGENAVQDRVTVAHALQQPREVDKLRDRLVGHSVRGKRLR